MPTNPLSSPGGADKRQSRHRGRGVEEEEAEGARRHEPIKTERLAVYAVGRWWPSGRASATGGRCERGGGTGKRDGLRRTSDGQEAKRGGHGVIGGDG